jgi:hypothetical protein
MAAFLFLPIQYPVSEIPAFNTLLTIHPTLEVHAKGRGGFVHNEYATLY